MRVAIVHDFLTQFGGAERVLRELAPLYPQAPIYTSLIDRGALRGAFDGADVRTTWLQRIPGAPQRFRWCLPLYPRAFESLDLRDYDLVLSSTTSFAKGVRVRPGALHVCYINTPTRFLWYPSEYAGDIVPWAARPLLSAMLPPLKRWDLAAAQRPSRFVANSRNVARRVLEVYGRTADVVHCPVTLSDFAPVDEPSDYYLVVSRLLPYKRVALAIEASALANVKLVIVGSGPDERRLRALAHDGVRFAGTVDDAERARLYARALAAIVPGEEDFGLVPLEAAASGRPAIAYAAGGALETVVEGETGAYFREATAASLAAVLRTFEPRGFARERLLAHARAFSPEVFRARMRALIDSYLTADGARD